MRHIDYGLAVFHRAAFEDLDDAPRDLTTVYQRLLARDELAALEVNERFYEIGSFLGIAEWEEHLSGTRRHRMTEFSNQYLREVCEIASQIDVAAADDIVSALAETRAKGGRLFILGVGGSAANASHAVNDFRKIAGLEAYAPTDNVSELTARTNDEGWPGIFKSWLRTSRLRPEDCILVLSVGGGNMEKNVSPNLVLALQYARSVDATVVGIVGRDGGYTAQVADACVVIPVVNPVHVTPHSESFQAVIWHLIVSHPALKQMETKWESAR